jgi:hypothetical protein
LYRPVFTRTEVFSKLPSCGFPILFRRIKPAIPKYIEEKRKNQEKIWVTENGSLNHTLILSIRRMKMLSNEKNLAMP